VLNHRATIRLREANLTSEPFCHASRDFAAGELLGGKLSHFSELFSQLFRSSNSVWVRLEIATGGLIVTAPVAFSEVFTVLSFKED
jgi:hypothetical protein